MNSLEKNLVFIRVSSHLSIDPSHLAGFFIGANCIHSERTLSRIEFDLTLDKENLSNQVPIRLHG